MRAQERITDQFVRVRSVIRPAVLVDDDEASQLELLGGTLLIGIGR